jgi:hypothetical protein
MKRHYGFAAIGATVLAVSLLNFTFAASIDGVPVVGGTRTGFSKLLLRVLPKGLGLALGTVGFAVIASFLTLYFARRHWSDPAMALVLFGICFVATRLLLADTIDRWGGFQLAIVSLFVEFTGLFALWIAKTRIRRWRRLPSPVVDLLWCSRLSDWRSFARFPGRIVELRWACTQHSLI